MIYDWKHECSIFLIITQEQRRSSILWYFHFLERWTIHFLCGWLLLEVYFFRNMCWQSRIYCITHTNSTGRKSHKKKTNESFFGRLWVSWRRSWWWRRCWWCWCCLPSPRCPTASRRWALWGRRCPCRGWLGSPTTRSIGIELVWWYIIELGSPTMRPIGIQLVWNWIELKVRLNEKGRWIIEDAVDNLVHVIKSHKHNALQLNVL